MNKKKNKRIWRWVVLLVVALAIFAYLVIPKSNLDSYEAATVKTGNISTYYSFSGNVSADKRDAYITQMPVEIDKIYFERGDLVEEDDVIIRLEGGRKLKANIDGKLILLDAQKGDKIAAGETLYDVADMDSLQVIIKVDEGDLEAVTIGNEVEVQFSAMDDKTIAGTVTDISDEAIADNNISYFAATIAIPYEEGIRLGMSAEVQVKKASRENVLLIPMQALQFDSGNNTYVFCANAKGKLEKRYITIGINDGSIVEVTSGLANGETVYAPNDDVKMLMPRDVLNDEE